MPGLLSRLAVASGVALESYGTNVLEDQRTTRLEKLRQAGSMERVERGGELGIEAADVAARRSSANREQDRLDELADSAVEFQRELDLVTHREEEKARVSGEDDETAALREATIQSTAKGIFDSANDGIAWSSALDMERWDDNKERGVADVVDKLKAGWTATEVYEYLDDDTFTPAAQPAETAPSGRDRISIEQIVEDKLAPGVTEQDILEQILATPELQHLHRDAMTRLGQ